MSITADHHRRAGPRDQAHARRRRRHRRRRWARGDRPGRHVRDARCRPRRHRRPEALRDRSARRVRLVSRLPGRDRGAEGTPASCTTPAAPGMRISTRSPRLDRLRRGVMELYLSDHPADCRAAARANARCTISPIGSVSRPTRYPAGETHLDLTVDDSNPYFHFDPAKPASSARAACAPATRSRARSP